MERKYYLEVRNFYMVDIRNNEWVLIITLAIIYILLYTCWLKTDVISLLSLFVLSYISFEALYSKKQLLKKMEMLDKEY